METTKMCLNVKLLTKKHHLWGIKLINRVITIQG